MQKVVLIVVDGMRPDAIEQLEDTFASKFLEESCTCLNAQTVMPSVTLPCHMSLFHSVTPERHGILTNTYTPQVRPVKGLCEVLSEAKKRCAAFYNWEPLRDLTRPGSLVHSVFYDETAEAGTDKKVTEAAIKYIKAEKPDFVFLYLGEADEKGHRYGWMKEAYRQAVAEAWNCIREISENFGNEYAILVTADHGGHGRIHGMDIPEDMTIPLILHSISSKKVRCASILDIAPTVTNLLDVEPDNDWEGESLL